MEIAKREERKEELDESHSVIEQEQAPQQSVMAVSDLSTFGATFASDYIFTRQDIQEYRREFNAKIINDIVITAKARKERFTQSTYIQILNRLYLQRPTIPTFPEATAHLESLSHEDFFDLVASSGWPTIEYSPRRDTSKA